VPSERSTKRVLSPIGEAPLQRSRPRPLGSVAAHKQVRHVAREWVALDVVALVWVVVVDASPPENGLSGGRWVSGGMHTAREIAGLFVVAVMSLPRSRR
jgi:hypothetical protein